MYSLAGTATILAGIENIDVFKYRFGCTIQVNLLPIPFGWQGSTAITITVTTITIVCNRCEYNSSLRRTHRQDLRSEEHTSELQSRENLVCRLLLEKKKKNKTT